MIWTGRPWVTWYGMTQELNPPAKKTSQLAFPGIPNYNQTFTFVSYLFETIVTFFKVSVKEGSLEWWWYLITSLVHALSPST